MNEISLKNVKPAKRYAEALFETENETDIKNILAEIDKISNTIKKDTNFKNFISHPIVSAEDKKDIILKVFPDISEITRNFIFLIIDENRINCINEIEFFLKDKIDNKNNVLNLNVTLAKDVDDEMKKYIVSRLQNKFQSNIKAVFNTDSDIIGGIQLKVKDSFIDLSIRKKLDNFKKI